MIRIGQSTDIHPLVAGRPMILGGVKIESPVGLMGHSDADALVHAVAEAILGALALGDLGKYFPDTDERYHNMDSIKILTQVVAMMHERHYHIVNIDSMILLEKPKLAPYIDQMRANIAEALQTHIDNVSIKATRGEKLGFIGRQEGVVAQAVVLIERTEESID